MPRIEQSDLDAIRDRISVIDLIAKHVSDMKDCGSGEYTCRCPFHDERPPSFRVYTDHWHCFGCGAHGDAIEAAMVPDRGVATCRAIRLNPPWRAV